MCEAHFYNFGIPSMPQNILFYSDIIITVIKLFTIIDSIELMSFCEQLFERVNNYLIW